jgi:hypothetical protein
MKYDFELGSSAMIYIPSFINIGSVIQKLEGGGGLHRHSMESRKPTFIFYQNK